MTINKIAKKYCADDKVQVMFSNAPSQIIFSKDGYLYLREQDVTIHRYLTDPVRKKMPYRNHPSSSNHATHLFEYDKVYAKFTRYRNMGRGYHPEDSYSLTFLYFVRAENGEALCAEIGVDSFESEEETTQTFSKAELEKFLYNLDGADAKCIFEWFGGIQYVKHTKEAVSICNDKFLNLSDEEIVRKCNTLNEPMYCLIFDEKRRAEMMADESWKVQSIEEVKDFVLTYHGGIISNCSPMILVIIGDEMYVYDFKVTLLKKDCFEVKSTKKKIALSYNDILRCANNCNYTHEPSFDDD